MKKEEKFNSGAHIRSELHPLSNVPDPCPDTAGIISRVPTIRRRESIVKPEILPIVKGGTSEENQDVIDKLSG